MYKFELGDLVTRVDGIYFNDISKVAEITARGLRFGTPCYGVNGKIGDNLYWAETDFKFIKEWIEE